MAMLKKLYVRQIEEQMLSFVNLVENFSKTDDDIISILDRANQYMKNPIRDLVNEFVIEARLSADLDVSFEKLIGKVEGTKLSEVFNCLWICAKHDSDYTEVIADMKVSVKEYMRSQKIVNAIINSARIDIIALLVAGIIVVKILNEFLSGNVIAILFSSFIGIGIIIYCTIVIIIALFFMFWR